MARLADGSSDTGAALGQRCQVAGAWNHLLFNVPELTAKDSKAHGGDTAKVMGLEMNLGSRLFPNRL